MFAKVVCAVGLVPLAVLGAGVAQGVTVDLSSPQEGSVVHPGDTVALTLTVTNDTAEKDVIAVTLNLTIDGLQHAVVARGSFRLRLDAGQSVTKTLSLTIPPDLPLQGPVVGTLEATAVGRRSQTQDSDSLTITLAP